MKRESWTRSRQQAAIVAAGVLALGMVSAPSGLASADGAHRASKVCAPVSATGVGQDLGGGSTVATVYVDDHAIGTTAATFTITGARGPILSFAGPIVFTSDPGTLTAQVTGTLNSNNGRFRSVSSSVTGTDELAGVLGKLRFRGVESLVDGSFTESITGRLCART
jgi:hypothetical protein